MEDKNSNSNSGRGSYVCNCCSHYGYGGYGGWYGGSLVRIVIGVVVALVIFWVGVKVGEFNDRYGYGDGYYGRHYPMMMQGYGQGGMMGGYGTVPPGMMNGAASSTGK